ncbi:MAG: hypothetical protein GXY58_02465 [Planctomycetaceae bacterium]|mgnify:CR=1 FL=1|nr:hypothetical protein [Planctomycetaceae bacterium]
MADEPTTDSGSRFRGAPPAARGRRSKADNALVNVSELETSYRRVDEMSVETSLLPARKSDSDDDQVDMTPMVDTTFLLLLFFMITAAFSQQRSLPVPTPHPDDLPSENVVVQEPSEDFETVTVHVDENNTFRVVSVDRDVEAPSVHEMLIQLRDACAGTHSGHRPTKLLVMANNEALHERVVAALDAGSQVGMEEIQLMMVEENE